MDLDRTRRNYDILTLSQAFIGGLVALVVALIYLKNPQSLIDAGMVEVSGALGLFNLLFFLSVHQFIKKNHAGISSAIMTVAFCGMLFLSITQTGGLDSPYYAFWLLALAASGIFGLSYSLIGLGVTLVYFLWQAALNHFNAAYLANHAVQLLVTIAAVGLAEWIYSRNRRVAAAAQINQALSGQLNEEQMKAKALMDYMADSVIVVDQQRRILLFNKAAQLMTGWDEDSAQGIDYRSVLSLKTADEKDIDDANDPFKEAWDKKQPVVHNDLAIMTRAGRKFAVTLSISPLFDPSGAPSGAIGVFRDISQEKEVERQRNEFISTASHEMRTPVASIEGYISLALNPKVAVIDDRAKGYLEKAHSNTQHLGQLFRDLLSITKMEEGAFKKKQEPLDMGKLVKDTVDDLQFTAQKKSLTLTFSSSGGGPAVERTITPIFAVLGDYERLKEVVSNLIDNAIKFTAQGGIAVGITGDEKQITVSISDSGPGIAKEDIPHLFQKFYRVDNSATRTIGGTGLGLYLCRQIIELHNGRIWVESEPGKGSTFMFSLPRIDSAKLTEARPTTAAPIAAAGNAPITSQPTAVGAAPAPVVFQPQTPTAAPAAPPAVDTVQAPVAAAPVVTPTSPPAAVQPSAPTVTQVPVSVGAAPEKNL